MSSKRSQRRTERKKEQGMKNSGIGSLGNLMQTKERLVNAVISPEKVPLPSLRPIVPGEDKEATPETLAAQKHREMIWKDAEVNRDYYLACQRESAQKGKWLPWFHFVKKEGQYSEFIMMNSQMAKEMKGSLWSTEEGNRNLKDALKDSYKRDFYNGHWIPSNESVGVDYNHLVYDGKHRLTALEECDIDYPLYITFNCLEEAKFVVDSGSKRSASEKLKMVIDAKLGNRTVGFCKAIMKGLQTKSKFTESEIAIFAHKWQPLIDWISVHYPRGRAEVQAALAKAYLQYGPEKIEPFCDRLMNIKFTEANDPAKALYLVLEKTRHTNIALSAYKKTLQAIEYLVHERGLVRVTEREEDIFFWTDNWDIPENSWWKKYGENSQNI